MLLFSKIGIKCHRAGCLTDAPPLRQHLVFLIDSIPSSSQPNLVEMFDHAKDTTIFGGKFFDIKGDVTTYEGSVHNENSNNTTNITTKDSYNDSSVRDYRRSRRRRLFASLDIR